MTQIVWKPIYAYSLDGQYLASSEGDIQRVNRRKVLSTHFDRAGYIRVKVSKDGINRVVAVHRLVADAFLGTCPKGMQVNHIDGDKTNNRPENLEYVSPSENILHSARVLKTHHTGAVLTEHQVREILVLLSEGVTQVDIAEQFWVGYSTVNAIKLGKSWKDIDRSEYDLSEAAKRERLTYRQIGEIRRLLSLNIPQTQIARQFGVHQSLVSLIQGGKRRS